MLHRLLSLTLILALLSTALPVAAETVPPDVPVDIPADASDAADPTESSDSGYRTLKRGDRDGDDSADIVILQNRLIELGYLRDAADGVYGKNTEDAVRALQRSNALKETGETSPELQELLYSGAELVTYSNSSDPESVTYRVQEKLSTWGFLTDEPDGVAGSKTNEAVGAFKDYLDDYLKLHPTPAPEATPAPTDFDVVVDMPIVNDVLLTDESRSEITEEVLAFVDGDYDFDVYSQTVANGDEGEEVFRVQRRLHQLKYLAVVDGAYGDATERAMLYFQKKNGLSQTAVADEATQRALFSESAVESEEFVNAYKLVVDVSDQRVYVYQWNGTDYNTCVGEMICSTGLKGKSTETPLGTYQAAGPTGTGEWYWFKQYQCYAKWGYRIIGGILFHSVIYSKGKVLNKTSVKKLGRRASHGCIRLKVEHAKWIYDNCPEGTTVVVQE